MEQLPLVLANISKSERRYPVERALSNAEIIRPAETNPPGALFVLRAKLPECDISLIFVSASVDSHCFEEQRPIFVRDAGKA